METQQQNIRSWDDLIFENRNKAYGAYAIRQSYDKGLVKGLFTSIGLAVAIFVIGDFINGGKIIEDVAKKTTLLILDPPPNVVPDVIQQKQQLQRVTHVNRNLTPIAVTTPYPPVNPDPEPQTTSIGTEGTSDGSATTDTGTSGGVDTGTEEGSGIVAAPTVFTHAQVMPAYKGGMEGMVKTLKKNMRYPRSAQQMGKEGTVFIEFVVNDEGDIQDVKVIRGFDLDCDKEAVRMVEKLTEWTPGLQNKMVVNVKMVLPIKFQIEQ